MVIKEFFGNIQGMVRKLWSGSEVKPIKVTAKTLQDNVLKIQKGLEKVQARINEQNIRIEEQEKKVFELTENYAEIRSNNKTVGQTEPKENGHVTKMYIPSTEEILAEQALRNARTDLEDMKKDLKDMHEVYSTLQEEMKLEYENIKKIKDGKFIMAPKDIISIAAMGLVGIFVFSLERENPRAVKMAEFILRLFPMHL